MGGTCSIARPRHARFDLPIVFGLPTPCGACRACTVTDSVNRRFYDLRPLIRPSGEDYSARDEATGDVYKINVCRAVNNAVDGVPKQSTGVYRQAKDGDAYSTGQYSDAPHISHDVLSLTYTGGSTCPTSTSTSMGSVIAFVCDHTVYGQGEPEFVASLGRCNFFFTWKTQYACSTSSAGLGSGLGVFVTAILILLAVYFGGFFLYNRFVLKRRGAEQIPPLGPSVLEAWAFVKDMALIIGANAYDKLNALLGRADSHRGFQGLPADEH